jgi:hypothetical protein
MKEALSPPKRRFLQEPHGVTSQKRPFFIILDRVTAVIFKHGINASNLRVGRTLSVKLQAVYPKNIFSYPRRLRSALTPIQHPTRLKKMGPFSG